MTPEAKAVEIYNKMFFSSRSIEIHHAKECAFIAVELIIEQLTPIEKAPHNKNAFEYWNKVISKLHML